MKPKTNLIFSLPMGEPRDIPYDAKIHNSAIRRMQAVESYRPGNLIVGGGGRGVKVAPKELGIGEWEVLKNHGGEDKFFSSLSIMYV